MSKTTSIDVATIREWAEANMFGYMCMAPRDLQLIADQMESLQAENKQLRKDLAYCQSLHSQQATALAGLSDELDDLCDEILAGSASQAVESDAIPAFMGRDVRPTA